MSTVLGHVDRPVSAQGVPDPVRPIDGCRGRERRQDIARPVPEPPGEPELPVVTPEIREQLIQWLYAEHGDFLLSFVVRLTGGDRQWAEDVRQETLLRAWRHADQLINSGAHSLRPWLTTVARRIVINNRRSRRSRPQEVDDAMLAVVPVPDDTERALQRTILVEALGQIAVAHRQVVVEMYLCGHTVEEVARRLGIPPGTVKSRSYYAMRALRTVLQERGVTL